MQTKNKQLSNQWEGGQFIQEYSIQSETPEKRRGGVKEVNILKHMGKEGGLLFSDQRKCQGTLTTLQVLKSPHPKACHIDRQRKELPGSREACGRERTKLGDREKGVISFVRRRARRTSEANLIYKIMKKVAKH